MVQLLQPTPFPVPGGKEISEFAGRVSSGHQNVSVAHMVAPPGWAEPAQRPDFDEVTYVVRGRLLVDSDDGQLTVDGGQAVLTRSGERVRYSVGEGGAEYVAVCVPAFSDETVHREG